MGFVGDNELKLKCNADSFFFNSKVIFIFTFCISS